MTNAQAEMTNVEVVRGFNLTIGHWDLVIVHLILAEFSARVDFAAADIER
jgi:hypothetical protein